EANSASPASRSRRAPKRSPSAPPKRSRLAYTIRFASTAQRRPAPPAGPSPSSRASVGTLSASLLLSSATHANDSDSTASSPAWRGAASRRTGSPGQVSTIRPLSWQGRRLATRPRARTDRSHGMNSPHAPLARGSAGAGAVRAGGPAALVHRRGRRLGARQGRRQPAHRARSEEHTSELQ